MKLELSHGLRLLALDLTWIDWYLIRTLDWYEMYTPIEARYQALTSLIWPSLLTWKCSNEPIASTDLQVLNLAWTKVTGLNLSRLGFSGCESQLQSWTWSLVF